MEPAPGLPERVAPIYILFDCSGSTQRDGWIAACNGALPALITAVERRSSAEKILLSVLGYADTGTVMVPLSEPHSLDELPLLSPSGLSSLAHGLQLAATLVGEDASQLRVDGFQPDVATMVAVVQDVGTDTADSLLLAAAELAQTRACLHVVHPAGPDRLALAGLGARRLADVQLPAAPDSLGRALVTSLRCERPCSGGSLGPVSPLPPPSARAFDKAGSPPESESGVLMRDIDEEDPS